MVCVHKLKDEELVIQANPAPKIQKLSNISFLSSGLKDLPLLPRGEDLVGAAEASYRSFSSRCCHLIREDNLLEEGLELPPDHPPRGRSLLT